MIINNGIDLITIKSIRFSIGPIIILSVGPTGMFYRFLWVQQEFSMGFCGSNKNFLWVSVGPTGVFYGFLCVQYPTNRKFLLDQHKSSIGFCWTNISLSLLKPIGLLVLLVSIGPLAYWFLLDFRPGMVWAPLAGCYSALPAHLFLLPRPRDCSSS